MYHFWSTESFPVLMLIRSYWSADPLPVRFDVRNISLPLIWFCLYSLSIRSIDILQLGFTVALLNEYRMVIMNIT